MNEIRVSNQARIINIFLVIAINKEFANSNLFFKYQNIFTCLRIYQNIKLGLIGLLQ